MIFEVLSKVFRQLRYSIIAVLIAFFTLSTAILQPNIGLLGAVFTSGEISWVSKYNFLIALYGSLATNFSVVSAVSTVLIAVLLGMNIALLVYYIRRRQIGGNNKAGNTASIAGIVAGTFGVGCAACGTVILSTMFAVFGGGGLLLLLPLHGAEFGVLGVILLSFSIYQLGKRINDPLVCAA